MAKKKSNKAMIAAALLGGWLLFSSFRKDNTKKGNGDDISDVEEYNIKLANEYNVSDMRSGSGASGFHTVFGNRVYSGAFFISPNKYDKYQVVFDYSASAGIQQYIEQSLLGFSVSLYTEQTATQTFTVGDQLFYWSSLNKKLDVKKSLLSYCGDFEIDTEEKTVSFVFSVAKAEWFTASITFDGYNNVPSGTFTGAQCNITGCKVYVLTDEKKKQQDTQKKYVEYYGETADNQDIVCQIDPATFYAQRFDDANSFGNDVHTVVNPSYFGLMYKYSARPFVIDKAWLDTAARNYNLINGIENPYYSTKAYLAPHSWKMPIYRFGFYLNITNNTDKAFYIKDFKLVKLCYNGVQLIDFSDDIVLKAAQNLGYLGGDKSGYFYDTHIRKDSGELFSYSSFPTHQPAYNKFAKKGSKIARPWSNWFNPNAPQAFFTVADFHANRHISIATETSLPEYYKKMFTVDYSTRNDGKDPEYYIPLYREANGGYLYEGNDLYAKIPNEPLSAHSTMQLPFILGFMKRGQAIKIGDVVLPLSDILQGFAPVYGGGSSNVMDYKLYKSVIDRIKAEQSPRFECACDMTVIVGKEEKVIPIAFGAAADAHGDMIIKDIEAHNIVNYNLTASMADNFYTDKMTSPEGSEFGFNAFIERWKYKRGL